MAKIGLAHAIKSLRAELADAITQGDGEDLRFKVEAIDLELAVACEVGSNGELSFQVLGLGGKLGGKSGRNGNPSGETVVEGVGPRGRAVRHLRQQRR